MSEIYLRNGHIEVLPHREDRFKLRLTPSREPVIATRYEVGLLEQFEDGMSIAQVLDAYPFNRKTSTTFLELCVERELLVPKGSDGHPRYPDLMPAVPTMFGAPNFDPGDPTAFVFAGVSLDTNTTGGPGARFGPATIRQAAEGCRYGYDSRSLQPRGFYDFGSGKKVLQGVTFSDAGDVHIEVGADPSTVYDRITDVARRLVESGSIPIFLGGDHSITYPILRAFPHERLGILHFDAHTDLGDVDASGLHHGNVFTMVLDKLTYVERVFQFGLRGFYEAPTAEPHKRATWYGIDQLRTTSLEAILEAIPNDLPYYLSIDIDVLDPSFAPSTGTPVAGGMYPHEMKRLVHRFCSERDVVGMDIVEVAQPLGTFDSTGSLAVQAIMAMADGLVVKLDSEEARGTQEESHPVRAGSTEEREND